MTTMNWEKLFSTKRLGDKASSKSNKDRSDYERDFDRVVFSSAFRRLQDKTQVIPLPESDFVHSRLTHSLEVSCVGRSLGKIVGEKISRKYKLGRQIKSTDFGSIVATACLAHDIGNPPFGHSGEGAISDFFKNGNGKVFEAQINDKDKWNDLINFEGNANGFRLLTNANSSTGGGIKLTYTTLATFTKYPCKSNKENTNFKGRASQDKFGYFQTEKQQFHEIFTHLGILKLNDDCWIRHPLAFLVEAADDICYRIVDLEDGVRIGLISFTEAETLLKSLFPKRGKDSFDKNRYEKIKEPKEKMGYLRAKAINQLITESAQEFWAHEEEILRGDYDKHITEQIKSSDILEQIKAISVKKIYNCRPVLQIEIAGFSVVGELLDYFVSAVNHRADYSDFKSFKKGKLLSSKIFDLLPDQYLGEDRIPDKDLYTRILQVCEFIAGMTDTYAMTLYKRLKGIELPHE